MTNKLPVNTDLECSRTIDTTTSELIPTPSKKIDLATIDDVRLEMARTYRGMRTGSIETSDGTKLVYVLCQIAKMIELYDIENRLTVLEGRYEKS